MCNSNDTRIDPTGNREFSEGENGNAAPVDGDRREPARATAVMAAETALLETKPNTVTDDDGDSGPRLIVSSCGCRSWFCPRCCVHKGLKLREEIRPVLETFGGVLMLTLTINPAAFEGDAVKAFRYVRDERCIARLIRELKRRGLVFSERWFRVVEWQENGFGHYHVLLDAKFIEQAVVHEIWNSYGPPTYAGYEMRNEKDVRLGLLSLNRWDAGAPTAAVNYAMKYLLKVPEYGFPDWVMQFDGRIRRYEKSRNFKATESNDNEPTDSMPDTQAEEQAKVPSLAKEERPKRRTIEQILTTCGQDAVLMLVHEVEIDGGEIIQKWDFLGKLKDKWQDIRRDLGYGDNPEVLRCNVPDSSRQSIIDLFGAVLPPNLLLSPPSPSSPSPYSTLSPPPVTTGTKSNETTSPNCVIDASEAEQLHQTFAAWKASGENKAQTGQLPVRVNVEAQPALNERNNVGTAEDTGRGESFDDIVIADDLWGVEQCSQVGNPGGGNIEGNFHNADSNSGLEETAGFDMLPVPFVRAATPEWSSVSHPAAPKKMTPEPLEEEPGPRKHEKPPPSFSLQASGLTRYGT